MAVRTTILQGGAKVVDGDLIILGHSVLRVNLQAYIFVEQEPVLGEATGAISVVDVREGAQPSFVVRSATAYWVGLLDQ